MNKPRGQAVTARGTRGWYIKMIHVAKRELGLDRDAYEALLAGATGERSCADMTAADLRRAYEALCAAGFRAKRLQVRAADRGALSGRQIYYVKGLWELAARSKSEASLRAIIQRTAGVDHIRFIPKHKASAVILALRDIAGKAGYDPDRARWGHADAGRAERDPDPPESA